MAGATFIPPALAVAVLGLLAAAGFISLALGVGSGLGLGGKALFLRHGLLGRRTIESTSRCLQSLLHVRLNRLEETLHNRGSHTTTGNALVRLAFIQSHIGIARIIRRQEAGFSKCSDKEPPSGIIIELAAPS